MSVFAEIRHLYDIEEKFNECFDLTFNYCKEMVKMNNWGHLKDTVDFCNTLNNKFANMIVVELAYLFTCDKITPNNIGIQWLFTNYSEFLQNELFVGENSEKCRFVDSLSYAILDRLVENNHYEYVNVYFPPPYLFNLEDFLTTTSQFEDQQLYNLFYFEHCKTAPFWEQQRYILKEFQKNNIYCLLSKSLNTPLWNIIEEFFCFVARDIEIGQLHSIIRDFPSLINDDLFTTILYRKDPNLCDLLQCLVSFRPNNVNFKFVLDIDSKADFIFEKYCDKNNIIHSLSNTMTEMCIGNIPKSELDNNCSVCYHESNCVTDCGHEVCYNCFYKLELFGHQEKVICPLCRHEIEMLFDKKYSLKQHLL